ALPLSEQGFSITRWYKRRFLSVCREDSIKGVGNVPTRSQLRQMAGPDSPRQWRKRRELRVDAFGRGDKGSKCGGQLGHAAADVGELVGRHPISIGSRSCRLKVLLLV